MPYDGNKIYKQQLLIFGQKWKKQYNDTNSNCSADFLSAEAEI